MTPRDFAWREWMCSVKAKLMAMENPIDTPELRHFFGWHYSSHYPMKFGAPVGQSMFWTPQALADRHGGLQVEVQAGRGGNPNYEPQSPLHKQTMRFDEFVGAMYRLPPNEIYMTANNTGANRLLIDTLAFELRPLPAMLTDNPHNAMLWIGRDTQTPIHHDLTNNLLIQHCGMKRVMMFPPHDHQCLRNTLHVYSDYRWLTEDEARKHGLSPVIYELMPGEALFIPVGWWHQVEAFGASIMTSYTNFPWPNEWRFGLFAPHGG